jgi:hypothetical protein
MVTRLDFIARTDDDRRGTTILDKRETTSPSGGRQPNQPPSL